MIRLIEVCVLFLRVECNTGPGVYTSCYWVAPVSNRAKPCCDRKY